MNATESAFSEASKRHSRNDSAKRRIRRLRRFRSIGFKVLNSLVLLLVVWAIAKPLHAAQLHSSKYVIWLAAAAYYSAGLVLAAWLFSVFSTWLRNSVVSLVCFATLFVWGSASYFTWRVGEDTARPAIVQTDPRGSEETDFLRRRLEVPNRAFSAFFPSRGGFERIDRRYLVQYHCFHLAVLALVAAVMFSLFGRGLVNRFKKRYVVPRRLLNVFWDVNDAGLLLARDLVETTANQQVAFLLPRELHFEDRMFKTAVARIDKIDGMWAFADFSNPTRSDARGHRHFFLGGSGHGNVSRANQLVRAMERFGIRRPDDVFLYVRIEAEEEERVFFQWAEKAKEFATPVLIRESDMTARRFVADHPMLDCPGMRIDTDRARVEGSFRILLLGLGATGRSVLREMVSNGQFVGASGFSVDVIEGNPAVVKAYRARHGEALEKYNIRLVENVRAEEPGFEDFLSKNLRSYNRIVVCLSGDVMNIRVATLIAHCLTEDGIGPLPGTLFVRVSDPDLRSYFEPGERMTLFGDLRDVYSLSTLDYDPLDRMARVLHWEWSKDKGGRSPEDAWHAATFNEQRSSRASALGERNLARVAGFEVVSDDDERPEVSKEEFDAVLSEDSGIADDGAPLSRATVLAEDEHLRWNAYHRMLGYSRWDMKHPPLSGVEAKTANQTETFGKHACLVDFSELPEVDFALACAIRKENRHRLRPSDFKGEVHVDVKGDGKPKASLQAYDYLFVRKIWENTRASGMKLVRAQGNARPI